MNTATKAKAVSLIEQIEDQHQLALHWLDRARATRSGETSNRFMLNQEKAERRHSELLQRLRVLLSDEAN